MMALLLFVPVHRRDHWQASVCSQSAKLKREMVELT